MDLADNQAKLPERAATRPRHPGEPINVTPAIELALRHLSTAANNYGSSPQGQKGPELLLRRAVADFHYAFNRDNPGRIGPPDFEVAHRLARDEIARDSEPGASPIPQSPALTAARKRLLAQLRDTARTPAERAYWTFVTSILYTGCLTLERYQAELLRPAA